MALDHHIVFFCLVPKRGGTVENKSEAFKIAWQLFRYYKRLNVESKALPLIHSHLRLNFSYLGIEKQE